MKHLDLFSGYGGFTISAKRLGWETIGLSEIDKYASSVLKFNFPEIKNYGDISEIDFKQFLGKVDIITGGSPCQDLSVAGKRKGLSGKRSGLFFEFIRAISESKPTYFVWENVKGAFSSNKGWDFAQVQIEMEQAGYDVWWQLLNAKAFGVPQNRERIFAIGVRKGGGREILFEQRDSGQNPKRVKDIRAKVSDSDSMVAIDLSTQEAKTTDNVRSLQARYNKGYSHRKAETSGVLVYDDYNSMVKMDGNIGSLTTNIGSKATRTGTKLIENMRIRRLTPTECERLMGLEDGWTAKGIMDGKEVDMSDTQRYKMCGNGVVVNCVDYIYSRL